MAKLTSKERDDLPEAHFAVPSKRELPIHDETHVRLAWDMVDRTKGLSSSERAEARRRIKARATELGMDTSGWAKIKATMVLHAMSLDLPAVLDHPNRMPFSGVLTRVGVASDAAPHGSNGRRVMLTADAAERAIPSLLGMGVDLTANLDGHDAQSKVGIITAAHIEGDAVIIEGFIYAADFPREALRIHLNSADLGFSFEAQNLSVESLDADPLVIKNLVFTGAAILMKDAAAYHTTSLAASAAKDKEMNDEMKAGIAAAVTEALGPLTAEVAKLKDDVGKVGTLAAAIEDLKKNPTVIHANKAVMDKVEPHAQALDAAASSMEAAGIGMHDRRGHVAVARRMAGAMRADAAQGKVPHEFTDSNSYYASADQGRSDPPPATPPAAPTFEDSAAYKELQTQIKAGADALAAANTKISDMQAASRDGTQAPDRKTLSPQIAHLLAKTGIEIPDGDKKLSVGMIDKALADAGISDTTQRLTFKTGLRRAGLMAP